MKWKIIFSLLFISFLSCETYDYNIADYGKIGNDKKQIDQILLNGKLSRKFNYDSQNRISQIINYYDGGNDTTFITYNKDNRVQEITYYRIYTTQFLYENGRLTESLNLNTLNPEWNMKIDYHYSGNRIDYADKSYNGTLTDKIIFGYDKKGNTISRIEYSIDESFKMEEYHYSYDNKPNPFINLPSIPMDVLQSNNPVKSFHYSLVMSSLPTEYGIDYKYDDDEFPISAKQYDVKNPNKILYNYTYIYN